MKRVKIVLYDTLYDEDDWNTQNIIKDGICDWEEITDEQYQYLQLNLNNLSKEFKKEFGYGYLGIVVQDDKPVQYRINSIKEFIDLQLAKIEERQKLLAKKKKEAAEKKAEKKALEEKEVYLKLKEKFEK
jgi:hypothetical protein